jgi:hypothetical protein
MPSKKRFKVKAPLIVVKVPGAQGGEVYLRRGRTLPESVESTEVKRLADLDLIEESEDPKDAGADEKAAADKAAADKAAVEKKAADEKAAADKAAANK